MRCTPPHARPLLEHDSLAQPAYVRHGVRVCFCVNGLLMNGCGVDVCGCCISAASLRSKCVVSRQNGWMLACVVVLFMI